jgi:hypothetical protein
MDTPQDKPAKKQLSNQEIIGLIRPHAPNLVLRALYIAEHGDNDNVKLGAIKLLLSKLLPDLKATEISGDDGKPLLIFDVKEYLRHHSASPTSTKTN